MKDHPATTWNTECVHAAVALELRSRIEALEKKADYHVHYSPAGMPALPVEVTIGQSQPSAPHGGDAEMTCVHDWTWLGNSSKGFTPTPFSVCHKCGMYRYGQRLLRVAGQA